MFTTLIHRKPSVVSNIIESSEIKDNAITFDKIDSEVWKQAVSSLVVNEYGADLYLEGLYVRPTDKPAQGDISGTFDSGLAINQDAVALGADTTGNYVSTIIAGLGIQGGAAAEGAAVVLTVKSGDGITVAGDGIHVALQPSGGLDIGPEGLSLLATCSDGQLLKWSTFLESWDCGSDDAGSSGLAVRETDTSPAVTPVSRIEFGPASDSSAEFVITDQGSGTVRVRSGTAVPLTNAPATVTATWTYTSVILASGGISCTGCIESLEIADSAIISPLILDGTIVAADIADGTLTLAKLGQNGCIINEIIMWSGSGWMCASLAASTNTFQTINGDTGSAVADTPSDTITLAGGDGLRSSGSNVTDSVTFDVDLASGSGLAFSSGALTLQSCAEGQLLKYTSGSWACAADDGFLAASYRQQLPGADNVSVGSSLTPLLTNGSGSAQSLGIAVGTGHEVSFDATAQVSSTLVTGPVHYVVVRDDNHDNDCATGAGDGTQIGAPVSSFIASVAQNFTTSFAFSDTSPIVGTNYYQLCASTAIAVGTTTITVRALKLDETNI